MISNKNILYLNYVYSKKMSLEKEIVFDDSKKVYELSNLRERT